jgi:hypothetical protein
MFPEDQVNLAISRLSRRKQFASVSMVIERIIPSLIVFSRDTCFDISPCMKVRDSAWSVLEGRSDVSVMASLGEDLMRNAPDTEDVSHALTSSALNVFLALRDVIDFCMGGDSTRISNVFALATDSVYLYSSVLEPFSVFLPRRRRLRLILALGGNSASRGMI